MQRVEKQIYYLDIAEQVAKRSTCLRRQYGAIIVKNDEIIATGYNGSPRGKTNCCDDGICLREKFGVPKGQRYELCRAVHAEQNAIISASRQEMIDSKLYIAGLESDGSYADPTPCLICAKMIVNSGIKEVIGRNKDGTIKVIPVEELKTEVSIDEIGGYKK